MPIYEYRCAECGHQLEALQKFSDAPLVECPECGKPALTKLISASAFQPKGTGWYLTDFRDKKKDAGTPAGEGGGKAPAGDKSAAADKAATGDKPAKGAEGGGSPSSGAADAPKKTGSES